MDITHRIYQIHYCSLFQLIQDYPDELERIKRNYLQLLSNLSMTTEIESNHFEKNIRRIHEMGMIIVGIMGDIKTEQFAIIASGTIIIEPKIIRQGKNVGHIEDIVVSKEMRNKGISQEILTILKSFASKQNCYKIILDCDEAVKKVYMKNGFVVKGIQMAEYM